MTTTATPPKTHNQPADMLILDKIQGLYDTAGDFADGEPIQSQEVHDTIAGLYDALHEAGKEADALRIEEKRPHDDAAKAVQDKYNPFIQPKKGKVDVAKAALGELLSAWRARVQAEKAAVAAAARAEADRLLAEAQAKMQATQGNLAARESAEIAAKEAAAVNRFAKQADKAATSGNGLRTVWRCSVEDIEAALDHYYPLNNVAFLQLVEELARVDVSIGVRAIPGVRVWSEQLATVGRAA